MNGPGIDVNRLPWSSEAEQSVLGGLLIDNSAWERAGDRLTRASFFDTRHGEVFETIGSLIQASKPADVVTVFERLQARDKAEECGGLVYLNQLAQSVPSAANVGRYAEIVAEKALHRALMQTADEASEIAGGDAPVHDKADRIMSLFGELQQRGQRSKPVAVFDLLTERVDHYNALAEGNVPPGISTGIAALDAALNGGMRPGKVIVLAARPSIGKSSLAEAILLHTAKAGHVSAFLSQEMERSELTDRAVSNLGGIGYGRLQNGKMSQAEWDRLGPAIDELAKLPLYFDDQPGLTLHDIRAKAMGLRRQGLKVLALDYIQLCAGSKTSRRENRNAEIEEISRGIKELAKEMGITVLVLSQLSRDVERRASPKPTLADLRDSGAIEQDADVVAMLWLQREFQNHKQIGLHLPKNRQGRPGVEMSLEFQGHYQRWFESCDADAGQGYQHGNNNGGFDA
ncbi:MAG: replicative DNA helicase [Paucibacter sp.]|nr:replicative DNA helicase [Roseateles sp.]